LPVPLFLFAHRSVGDHPSGPAVTDEPSYSSWAKPRAGALHSTGTVILALALSAIAAACAHSPAAPSGTDAVTVVSVSVPNGGTAPSGSYYEVVTVQFQATSDLNVPTIFGGYPVAVSYLVFVCLSADGSQISNTCQAVSGSENVPHDAAVQGPDARRDGPTQTNYVVAFMIKVQDYHPFVAGMSVPASAIAEDVKPWVINWQ
jgi:hypothetical protein